eukprot:CAMPEP_0169165362 /NCGR_PEP_ID=MMETSP1015-20121227/59371_1 /TAXON_ID=342587 /ORGANISM="Karlodinium micrum, Strain CCMP2283" /LENGTH=56 /DNA_ID=CAMNT_0009237947 /DNA_START=328 /DNA_END=498 /DNA_ORIENTATION=+
MAQVVDEIVEHNAFAARPRFLKPVEHTSLQRSGFEARVALKALHNTPAAPTLCEEP